mmetsp:Transcript_14544/g.31613  ORF Transcript_14544/g.31613 Transcript_14544/m.31613 type:complete len:113 (-) Transcript_14544:81-419(-)
MDICQEHELCSLVAIHDFSFIVEEEGGIGGSLHEGNEFVDFAATIIFGGCRCRRCLGMEMFEGAGHFVCSSCLKEELRINAIVSVSDIMNSLWSMGAECSRYRMLLYRAIRS